MHVGIHRAAATAISTNIITRMAKPKVTLYVDTVSPFAYLAYYILRNDPVFTNCDVSYVPIFLGGVMKACGNTPPINIKNKDKWIEVERKRWAHGFKIPMVESVPEGFPPMTLTIMRALCALTVLHPVEKEEGREALTKALDALFKAFWVDGKKTNEKDVLVEVLRQTFGESETKRVMEMAGKEGKEVLTKNTDKAFADGAFGLPWFVATNAKGETEGFWGVDHLGQVTAHLGLEKPKVGGWKALL